MNRMNRMNRIPSSSMIVLSKLNRNDILFYPLKHSTIISISVFIFSLFSSFYRSNLTKLGVDCIILDYIIIFK